MVLEKFLKPFVLETTPWVDSVVVDVSDSINCRYDVVKLIEALDEFLGEKIPPRTKVYRKFLYSYFMPTGEPYGEGSSIGVAFYAELHFEGEETILKIVEFQSP